MAKLTQEQADERIFEVHGDSIWRISDYTRARDKHKFVCKCGNIWYPTYDNIVNKGQGCPLHKYEKASATRFKPNKKRTSKKYKNCIEIQLCDKEGNQCAICYIDKEDWVKVKHLRWYLSGGYAYNNKVGLLHRFITDCPKGLEVDHRFHKTLDNRKSKLRICTHKDNLRNQKVNTNTLTGLKGVNLSGSRYTAKIEVDGKSISLGVFNMAR